MSAYACKCGCGLDSPDQRLVASIETLHRALRVEPHILSGCRCAAHNLKVGGAKASAHMLGLAADITVPGVPLRQVARQAMRIPALKGIGLDEQRSMLHVDVRDAEARWVYLGGKAVPGWPLGLEA